MDPVTHAVIGMSVVKLTGNAIDPSNPAAVGIIIGSVFPDVDILLQKWGDYVYLKNHRGVSHSIPGLIMSAALITAALSVVYGTNSIWPLFLYTLAGCFSHVLFDIFNSYGAQILWPLSSKKYSLSLLIIFDPIFIGLLSVYSFSKGRMQYILMTAFLLYLLSRALMRKIVYIQLEKVFGASCMRINILPSMTGLLRWHFIIEQEHCNIIGEKNLIKNGIKIIERFEKIQDEDINKKVLLSPVGKFFSEFTPLFHVISEKLEGITRYVFIDLRYYMKNKFLHHAILEMDENDSVIKATFNPYSMSRSTKIQM